MLLGLGLAKVKLVKNDTRALNMEVIPVINCSDALCVEKRLKIIEDIGSAWVHIDVADGKFAPSIFKDGEGRLRELFTTLHQAQIDPRIFSQDILKDVGVNLEVHLMAENPEEAVCDWLEVNPSRIIVHAETIKDFDFIESKCDGEGVDVGVSIICDSENNLLIPYISHGVRFFQVLAVDPGLSGQKFNALALEKVKFLRAADSEAIIEVDGGINPETARLVKNAGANILVSGSYIFDSASPSNAYGELKSI